MSEPSVADLIWIARFVDALRELQPRYAAPDAFTAINDIARHAMEQPGMRDLAPRWAAAVWIENESDRMG